MANSNNFNVSGSTVGGAGSGSAYLNQPPISNGVGTPDWVKEVEDTLLFKAMVAVSTSRMRRYFLYDPHCFPRLFGMLVTTAQIIIAKRNGSVINDMEGTLNRASDYEVPDGLLASMANVGEVYFSEEVITTSEPVVVPSRELGPLTCIVHDYVYDHVVNYTMSPEVYKRAWEQFFAEGHMNIGMVPVDKKFMTFNDVGAVACPAPEGGYTTLVRVSNDSKVIDPVLATLGCYRTELQLTPFAPTIEPVTKEYLIEHMFKVG